MAWTVLRSRGKKFEDRVEGRKEKDGEKTTKKEAKQEIRMRSKNQNNWKKIDDMNETFE